MGQNLLVSVTLIIFSVHLILGEEFTCPRSRGYYPHPTECKKYYSCRKLVSTLKECPEEMLFDVKKGNCYINSAVDCGSRKKPSVTVVTIAEIREENGTEGSWNTHSFVVTETSIAPSQDSTGTVFPLQVNTSKITTISATNETDNPNNPTITTGIPETEIIVDNSNYTISETSTDSKRDDLYTTENHLDNSNETFSDSTSGNKVTDVGELNITLIASTEGNTRNGDYGTTENGVNDTSFVFTDYQDSSTVSSQKVIVDDSNSTVMEASTESKEDNIFTTVMGLDNSTEAVSESTVANEVTDKGELNVTSIVSTEHNTRTSVEHESLATTEYGLNDTSIMFTDYLNNLTVSSSPRPYTDNTDSGFWNGTSDANDSITVATEITTKSVDESSVSYLWNVTEEPDFTIEGSEKSSTADEESTSTTKLVSSSTDVSHKEHATTEKEVGSTSSKIETIVVSDEVEINTTSSNEGIMGSTAEQPVEVITHSSTESTSHVKVTTEQHTTIADDYYENDFDCPTPYGRYPHPTDKHKFLHCQEWFPHVMVCPADLIFDEKLEICVWSKASLIMY